MQISKYCGINRTTKHVSIACILAWSVFNVAKTCKKLEKHCSSLPKYTKGHTKLLMEVCAWYFYSIFEFLKT